MSGDKLDHTAAVVRFHRVAAEFARLGVELLEPHSFCCFLRTTADATERFSRAAGSWDEGAYALQMNDERQKLEPLVARLLRQRSDG